MRSIAVFLAVASIVAPCVMAGDGYTYRCEMHNVVANAKEYVVIITNGTFEGVSTWTPESEVPPPLSQSSALRLATVELARLVPNPSDYPAGSIRLNRFFETGSWYYVVFFDCPNWQETEPYKSLLEAGDWPRKKRPVIHITILLNGRVIDKYQPVE